MLFQFAALILREWMSRVLIDLGVTYDVARLQSAWAGFAALMILLVPVLRSQRKYLLRLFERPGSWMRLITIAIATGLTMRILSWGISVIGSSIESTAKSGSASLPFCLVEWLCPGPAYSLLFLLTLALATPFVEECINRGLLLGELQRRRHRFAVPLSAILFAVLHAGTDFAAAFTFGVVAATLRLNSRTLWGPLVSHATFNTVMYVDFHCLRFIGLEDTLLAMSGQARAVIGGAMVIIFLYLSLRLARLAGAGG